MKSNPGTGQQLLLLSLLGLLFTVLNACNRYYMAEKVPTDVFLRSMDSLEAQNRFFILRSGNQQFIMNQIMLSDDHKTLQCKLGILPKDHQLHLQNGIKGKHRYTKKRNTSVYSTKYISSPDLQNRYSQGPTPLRLTILKKSN